MSEKREMTCREAGQIGGKKRAEQLGHEGYVDLGRRAGEATLQKHGVEHYERIGRDGGTQTARRYGHAHFKEIGKKGGQRLRDLVEKGRLMEELHER